MEVVGGPHLLHSFLDPVLLLDYDVSGRDALNTRKKKRHAQNNFYYHMYCTAVQDEEGTHP